MKKDIDSTHNNSDDDDDDEPLEEQHDDRSIINNSEEDETNSVEDKGGILKPYKCKACGRGFAYPHTLKYHIKHNCKRNVKGNGFINGNGLVKH